MSATDSDHAIESYPTTDHATPIEAAYMAVAEASGRDPLDLPPIAEAIDVDGLNRLLDEVTEPVSVSFEYAGWDVTITEDSVRVDEICSDGEN